MPAFLLDLRLAIRVLTQRIGTSALAILTLALAIGATTAIFSVVYGVLLRPLPYPEPDRLMAVWEVNTRGTYSRLADPNFEDFRDRNQSFVAMAKFTDSVTSVVGPNEPTRTRVASVTRDFFAVLGVQPARGRGFAADDARIGANPVVVVSHEYWMRSLGSAPSLSNLDLRIGDRIYTVVGVMPAGFEFPANVEIWAPAELEPGNTSRTSHNYLAVGRLKAGVTVAHATADLSRIAQDIIRRTPERSDFFMTDATALPLQTSLTGRVETPLYVLLGAVFFLLLVACANVTNLLLAQAAARQRELAIRHALGAGRARLVRQFVAEALVLLTVSGLVGVVIASLGISALLSLAPADLPRLSDVSMNRTVLGFAMGLSAVVAIALGLMTAIRATSGDPRDTLVDGARGQTSSASSQRIGRVIVAGQLAITVVILIGAALLGRSLMRVLSVDPGFRTDGVVAMDLSMPYSDDPAARTRLVSFYANVFDRLRAIPGVEAVAATNAVPLDGGLPDGMFALVAPGEVVASFDDVRRLFAQKDRTGTADFSPASSDYFQALGIPIVRGRLFDDRDRADQPHVAVISESLARTRWPDADPIGQAIEFGNMDGDLRPITIVGVVGDVHVYGPERPARPTVYVNMMQRPRFQSTVVMRSTSDPRLVIASARTILREVAPDVPPRFRTFAEIYAASLGARRFNLTLVATFAGTALVLAMAGIYGVMAYSVSQRRRDIGVRIALGASPGRMLRSVLGQGLLTTAIGVAIGTAVAVGLTRTLQTLLFEIQATDPATFAVGIAVTVGVATLACYVPARRATRVDPIEALRQG